MAYPYIALSHYGLVTHANLTFMITACSFLPAVTSMLQYMKLDQHLVGVTFECKSTLPKIIRSTIEDNHYDSVEINDIVAQSQRDGISLYYIDKSLLAQLQPDIIFTQDVCPVCQISTDQTKEAVKQLDQAPTLVPLLPKRLSDVYQDAITIATTLGKENVAHEVITQLKQRVEHIQTTLNKHQVATKQVMLMEWVDPIYTCGHWIPDQIMLAGGYDAFANPGGYSVAIKWQQVIDYDPEILIIAACGFDVDRTAKALQILKSKPEWAQLKSVSSGQVYCVDGELFTQPSINTLIDGIEVLATIFHPSLFPIKPEHSNLVTCISADE